MDGTKSSLDKFRDLCRGIVTRQKPVSISPPPSVSWILEHLSELSQRAASTKGVTPLASLHRMYEYLVAGFTNGLRTEIEFFFNRASWAVADIPDPQDPDPERYAVLAVLPSHLVRAFNRLIERGLPRDSPRILTKEIEEELEARPVVLEREPSWVARVSRLERPLVIPTPDGDEPKEEFRHARYLEMNIIAEEPHILFV